MNTNRREFIKQTGMGALALGLSSSAFAQTFFKDVADKKLFFEISLAEFSFASDLYSGKLDNLDFPAKAKNEFGINVVEYVSGFFNGKVSDATYLKELKKRTDDLGVKNNLIMIDQEGDLADLDAAKRQQAVENHYKWVDAAVFLGCKSIRVNLGSLTDPGDAKAVADSAVIGYSKLVEHGAKNKINVIVENHFGHSANGAWLAGVMKQVHHAGAGTLPDFGNFCEERTKPETMDLAGYMKTKCIKEYDKYKGVTELMPYAKGVSAKTHKFDANGNETEIDYARLMKIVKDAGFKGYVGIEYEGGLMRMGGDNSYLSNEDGVKATKALLERVGAALS